MELLSALMDGELPDEDAARALALLAGADGQAQWRAWKAIGDALRAGLPQVDQAMAAPPAEALP